MKKIEENGYSIRIFFGVGFFLYASASSIAINRWWTNEVTGIYLVNLFYFVTGYVLSIIFISKSKLQTLGLASLAVAIYYIACYEIGEPSIYYLTPFDLLFGFNPIFNSGEKALIFHKAMGYITSIISGLILAFASAKLRCKSQHPN